MHTHLSDLAWRLLAFILSRRPIAAYLIRRAQRTPYFHLPAYMERWWLFNAYDSDPSLSAEQRRAAIRFPRLPSIRIHHILRADDADHLHDHPWAARTIILAGWYVERRQRAQRRVMARGATGRIDHGSYHHIEAVSDGGVWTLFLTWDYLGTWGFLVDGQKVPWREYEHRHGARADIASGDGTGLPLSPFDGNVARVAASISRSDLQRRIEEIARKVANDRLAIRMLVAAGYVAEAKANEALQIAHGFATGQLAPAPRTASEQGDAA